MSVIIKSIEEGNLGAVHLELLAAKPLFGNMGERIVTWEERELNYEKVSALVVALLEKKAEELGENPPEAELINECLARLDNAFSAMEKAADSIETFEFEKETLLQTAQRLFASIWG